MKLAIAQMVLGALIVVDWGVTMWGMQTLALLWEFPSLTFLFVLGLAVLGCGIAQYLKARAKGK